MTSGLGFVRVGGIPIPRHPWPAGDGVGGASYTTNLPLKHELGEPNVHFVTRRLRRVATVYEMDAGTSITFIVVAGSDRFAAKWTLVADRSPARCEGRELHVAEQLHLSLDRLELFGRGAPAAIALRRLDGRVRLKLRQRLTQRGRLTVDAL
jgi:hypothetical protein